MNSKWYEAWSERTLFVEPIINDVQGLCSRGCKANLVTVITPDTPPLIKNHKLVGGRSRGQLHAF